MLEDCGRIGGGSLLLPWLVLQSFVDGREQKCLKDEDGGGFCNDWGRKASSQGWFVYRSPETGRMCCCRSILECKVRGASCRRVGGGGWGPRQAPPTS